MPIENRELKPGTKLVAKYKGKEYSAEVVGTEAGMRYRLEDGREFKSPSAAGSAILKTACNGWRFWGLADEAAVQEDKPKTERKPGKVGKRSKKEAGFDRLEDGRAFCNACMAAFEVADDQEPAECPKGHKPSGAPAPAE